MCICVYIYIHTHTRRTSHIMVDDMFYDFKIIIHTYGHDDDMFTTRIPNSKCNTMIKIRLFLSKHVYECNTMESGQIA